MNGNIFSFSPEQKINHECNIKIVSDSMKMNKQNVTSAILSLNGLNNYLVKIYEATGVLIEDFLSILYGGEIKPCMSLILN